MKYKLKAVNQSWAEAVRRMQLGAEFSAALHNLHLGFGDAMTKELFLGHLDVLVGLFRDFASRQVEFCELPPHKRELVVQKAGPLFLQYLLAGYLSASSHGAAQLAWITQGRLRLLPDEAEVRRVAVRVSPAALNSILELFTESDLRSYELLLGDVELFEADRTPLVAAACLYHDCRSLDGCFEEAVTLAEWAQEVMGAGVEPAALRRAVLALEEAHTFFEKFHLNAAPELMEEDYPALRCGTRRQTPEIAMPYSADEQRQLELRIQVFDAAYNSVRPR